ncbi:class V aminotransferase [Enterococcus ureilyticus]|uniref:cysteine desulfurase n=1 Tax=Enterococcus ureilyticus TaxID=1131292 RepID=A0A1E5HCL5_9ENTE|nr:selenocysteine lyase SclA [Enterococcus ureilyticus]MBM7687809.1 cysteine desulfurase family protein [Enterococcus ureilyticus]MBO0447006.1 aminotransferase class V-fold PLP-dependent enzyme [Enterococcus ureilyticus]OEG22688.1 class V aminotransferase [Enterococcus ureilyticus]
MKQPVYLNHAATSNHKFAATVEELCHYLTENNNLNTNRGSQNIDELELIFDARQVLANFFQAPDPAHIIFTANATTSLNMILNGLLKTGDHVITTAVEHNAVARPLHRLEVEGQISVTRLCCDQKGQLDPDQLKSMIRPETKVLVMTHASNVLGTILPVSDCFKIARNHGVITVLDSAQTAGFLPIDMTEMSIDVLAFTGHKGLMGLSGIGGFALAKNREPMIDPWLTGGTGSASLSFEQPVFLPDKFEPGTLNMLGILSLKSAIQSIERIGLNNIAAHEQLLTKRFLEGLEKLPVTVLGTSDPFSRVPVVSITVARLDAGEFSQLLFDRYQIITRSGLHCAPLAHQTAGTLKSGAVRFSFGWNTSVEEIDYTLQAIKEILSA